LVRTEFYLGYAISRKKLFDRSMPGPLPPDRRMRTKISSVLQSRRSPCTFSRGVRWDSDIPPHDWKRSAEIVWGGYAGRVLIGLDYFDASIQPHRCVDHCARNVIKALLLAFVLPLTNLQGDRECKAITPPRLAAQRRRETLPFGAVWGLLLPQAGCAARRILAGRSETPRGAKLSKRQ